MNVLYVAVRQNSVIWSTSCRQNASKQVCIASHSFFFVTTCLSCTCLTAYAQGFFACLSVVVPVGLWGGGGHVGMFAAQWIVAEIHALVGQKWLQRRMPLSSFAFYSKLFFFKRRLRHRYRYPHME